MIRLTDAVLLLLLVGLGCYLWGAHNGHADGVLACTAKADSAALTTLRGAVASHQSLIAESNAASVALRQLAVRRERADQKTTQELRHVLKNSAPARAGCRFDDDSLRIVATARERAAEAAAGGAAAALPDTR